MANSEFPMYSSVNHCELSRVRDTSNMPDVHGIHYNRSHPWPYKPYVVVCPDDMGISCTASEPKNSEMDVFDIDHESWSPLSCQKNSRGS